MFATKTRIISKSYSRNISRAISQLTFSDYQKIGKRSLLCQKRLQSSNLHKENKLIQPNPTTLTKSKAVGFFTIPNIITLTRIGCTPMIGYFILTNHLVSALGIFAYSCVTDYLDGYIARRFNLKSVAGTILDPIADKLLMVITTMAMTFAPGPQIIPLGVASLILGRDVLLGLSGAVVRYTSVKSIYGRTTWKSYWDFMNFPSVEVKPTLISKWNTFFQMIYLGLGGILLLLRENELNKGVDNEMFNNNKKKSSRSWLTNIFTWQGYLVGATTILSGGSYIFSKNAVRLLTR